MLINLVIICLVNVLIIDLSGVVTDLKLFISKWLTQDKIATTNFRIKPLDCSFCMTFWTSLLYIIVNSQFTLVNMLIILLLAFMTEPIKQFLLLLKDLLLKIINVLYETFKI